VLVLFLSFLSWRLELGELPEVGTAARLFQNLVYQNKDRLTASIIVGGWDPHNGGSVYCIPLGGVLVKQPFAIGGSYHHRHHQTTMAPFRGLATVQGQGFLTTALG